MTEPPVPPSAADPATPPAPPAAPPAAPPTGEPATPPAPKTPEELQAEVDKWKTFSRKHEDEAKANRDAAAELATLKAANLTELEKAQKRAADLEAESAKDKAEALRLRVAVKHGIPADDFDLLGSGSEEELEARAARIAAKNAATKVPPVNFDGGPRPPATPTDLAGQIVAAEEAGDLKTARALKTQQLRDLRRNMS